MSTNRISAFIDRLFHFDGLDFLQKREKEKHQKEDFYVLNKKTGKDIFHTPTQFSLMTLFLSLWGCGGSKSDEARTVNCDERGTFDTIQEAIDDIASDLGLLPDVEVCPGNYSESLVINDAALTIKSREGRDSVYISGDGENRPITMTDAMVELKGLNIVDGYSDGDGGGILSSGYNASLDLIDCDVSNNIAEGNGGAIAADTMVRIYSGTIANNSAQNGGAFSSIGDGGWFRLDVFDVAEGNGDRWGGDVTISGNVATDNGPTAYVTGEDGYFAVNDSDDISLIIDDDLSNTSYGVYLGEEAGSMIASPIYDGDGNPTSIGVNLAESGSYLSYHVPAIVSAYIASTGNTYELEGVDGSCYYDSGVCEDED